MIEAGPSEVEAMQRGGWKTRSIFEHYHITQEKAEQEAARKMEARPKLSFANSFVAQEMGQIDGRAEIAIALGFIGLGWCREGGVLHAPIPPP